MSNGYKEYASNDVATTSTAGLMSASDKEKLDRIDEKVSLYGGNMSGELVAQVNTNYTTYQVRNIAFSNSAATPTGNGNILAVYS